MRSPLEAKLSELELNSSKSSHELGKRKSKKETTEKKQLTDLIQTNIPLIPDDNRRCSLMTS